MEKKNLGRYGAGVAIGALLALGGVGQFGKVTDQASSKPEVKIVERVVEKKVYVNKDVVREKMYRVSILDDSGKVIKTFKDITKFEFRIIGATLTNKAGKTFKVDGNVTVDRVK
jgi:RNase P/RNase MRP subunit p29